MTGRHHSTDISSRTHPTTPNTKTTTRHTHANHPSQGREHRSVSNPPPLESLGRRRITRTGDQNMHVNMTLPVNMNLHVRLHP